MIGVSLVITLLEAFLIGVYDPIANFELLVETAWHNISAALVLSVVLRSLERTAEAAEQGAGSAARAEARPTSQRLRRSLVEHVTGQTSYALNQIKLNLGTLENDPMLRDASYEAVEESHHHIRRAQLTIDEYYDYTCLTQSEDIRMHLKDYSPRVLLMGVQREYEQRGIQACLSLDESLPQQVFGMPGATRRALVRLADYLTRITGSTEPQFHAEIARDQRWAVRITAPRTAPVEDDSSPPSIDVLTLMACEILGAMGGRIEFTLTSTTLAAIVYLPWKMQGVRSIPV